MFFLKKLIFKLMELGLGLRTYFDLQTRNPVFVNFRLTEAETDAVRRALPEGFTLRALRFVESEPEPAFWLSFNLYELRYPRKEMAVLRKVRCEINTFVRDPEGREGVFVFCGSPYVSKEENGAGGVIGKVADLAERLVIFLYGCGRLTRVRYELSDAAIRVDVDEPDAQLALDAACANDGSPPLLRLSDDYHRFNDVSFFGGGATHDFVSTGSAFFLARFEAVEPGNALARSPFFGPGRRPDRVYVHRGEIGYLVNALNRAPPRPARRP